MSALPALARFGASAAFATMLTATIAGPVAAHGGSLPDLGYYRSTVTAVEPAVSGLQVKVETSGESVTLTNRTGLTVTVLGYTGEPYLQITPTGVDENVNSLSSFLNGSLVIQGLPQQLTEGSEQKPPQWKHVADQPTFTWHDHRIHWMAQRRPPVVEADPHHPHHVFDWTMRLTAGQRPVTVDGSLDWSGAPLLSGTTIALLVIGGVFVVLAAGLLILRARNSRSHRPPRVRQPRLTAASPMRAPASIADRSTRTSPDDPVAPLLDRMVTVTTTGQTASAQAGS